MQQTTMAIAGMSCGGCVSAVQKALRAVPGARVDDVTVGSATVSYDASLTNPAALAQAVDTDPSPQRYQWLRAQQAPPVAAVAETATGAEAAAADPYKGELFNTMTAGDTPCFTSMMGITSSECTSSGGCSGLHSSRFCSGCTNRFPETEEERVPSCNPTASRLERCQ